LFIGLSFIAALSGVEIWQSRRAGRLLRIVVAVSAAIIFMGGFIAGWPPQLRLSQPYRVAVGGHIIEPQGPTAARWMRSFLGPGNVIGAGMSNGLLMLAYGEQHAYAGNWPDTDDILETPDMPEWQKQTLQRWQIQFFAVDRRLISQNNMAGLYFDQTGGGPIPITELFPPEIYEKFDRQPSVSRIFDSGNIVIYDVKVLSNVALFK
jgi:hypothetical protein